MARALAQYHRQIVKALDAGESQRAIARSLGVPRGTLKDYVNDVVRQHAGPVDVQDNLGDMAPVANDALTLIERDYSSEEKHLVYPLGDVHVGAAEHAREKWTRWLKYLDGLEHASLLFTGDALNCAIPGSKSDVISELMPYGKARRTFRDDVRPLAEQERLDVLIDGNHENRVWRATGDSPMETVADELGAPFAPGAVVLVYHVGDIDYVFFMRHGTGSAGTTPGAVGNALQRSANVIPEADVVLQGHTHTQLVAPRDQFVLEREPYRLERRKQYLVSSGSFVGYALYAAERGYPPTHIGAPRIYLDGRRRDVHVSV